MSETYTEAARAARRGELDRLDECIAEGLDPTEESSDGWNLLHRVFVFVRGTADPKVVRRLVEIGVDANHRDNSDWTPLHYAARRGDVSSIPILVDAGADVEALDEDGISPLHRAIASLSGEVRVSVVTALVRCGAKITDDVKSLLDEMAGGAELLRALK